MAQLLNEYLLYVVILAVGIFAGVICCKYANKKNNSSTLRDVLTGGMTESAFLQQAAAGLKNKGDSFTAVSMEFENWDKITNAFGNDVCANAVKHIYSVLDEQLSSSEYFVRTGEDSFSFFLKNRKTEEVYARLDRIYDGGKRFVFEGADFYSIQLVFGIYQSFDRNEEVSVMLEKAKYARVNMSDEQRYRLYDSSYDDGTKRNFADADALNNALSTHEFIVYFQPKVRTFDRKITGAEALIRWRHSTKGLLTPDMFLKYADKYQITSKIDLLVVESVCAAMARWKRAEMELCPVSVNVSKASFDRYDFAEKCSRICVRHAIEPSLLEFELKEDMLLENEGRTQNFIDRLHEFGFRCAVDNFGKSHTSLRLLGTCDIDTVKLDRSFFNGENDNRKGRFIIESILKLTTQLHIKSVAEGIEKFGQVQYLQKAACDAIQGFYYYKPMPLEAFESNVYDNGLLGYAPENKTTDISVEKKSALLAEVTESKSIVMLSYFPDEDKVEFSEIFSPVLNKSRKFTKALALFRATDLLHENDREEFLELIERCKREEGWVENTLRFYVNGNRYRWLELHLRKDGNVISGTMINTAEWKNEVDRWKEKATRDALTGLYNREHFEQTVQSQIEQKAFTSAAMLFIDVDDFKRVNDTMGHIFGDDVLCYVAKQILGVFRHTDVIARYGGDEFVVFAPSIQREVLVDRLNRLYGSFKYPYRNGSVEYKVSVTIGSAMFPEDGMDYDVLLDHADCALYEAKARGKAQFVLYEPYMKGETKAD